MSKIGCFLSLLQGPCQGSLNGVLAVGFPFQEKNRIRPNFFLSCKEYKLTRTSCDISTGLRCEPKRRAAAVFVKEKTDTRSPDLHRSIVGSVVECSPATRAARVRFPDDARLFFLFSDSKYFQYFSICSFLQFSFTKISFQPQKERYAIFGIFSLKMALSLIHWNVHGLLTGLVTLRCPYKFLKEKSGV